METPTPIDDAVETKDDFPREDAQQIAGPERNGEQNNPDQLGFLDTEGHEIGHRISKYHDGDGCNQRHPQRFDDQDAIERTFGRKQDAVIVKVPSWVDVKAGLRPKTDNDDAGKRHDHQSNDDEKSGSNY